VSTSMSTRWSLEMLQSQEATTRAWIGLEPNTIDTAVNE